MTAPESPLAQAVRHVIENMDRIAKQRTLIAKLERDGHERLLPDAQKLLIQMEEAQRLATHHLEIERAESET